MALVDYSGSEDSDQEVVKTVVEPKKLKPTSGKPTFQRLVDSSNPRKIQVSLPEPMKVAVREANTESEHPAKRAKIGAGAVNDFNSLLPAPKRPAASGNGIKPGGMGRGVNLKTGATPGFTREPMAQSNTEYDNLDGYGDGGLQESAGTEEKTNEDNQAALKPSPVQLPVKQPKKKATMFKPLSVARKPHKKKPPLAENSSEAKPRAEVAMPGAKVPPKVSLFSVGESEIETGGKDSNSSAPKGAYQPLLYKPKEPSDPEPSETAQYQNPQDALLPPSDPQSLTAIADTLNLSASAKRQLLGRNPSQKSSAINIVNFNTDQEYMANEEMRQSGEVVQHNAIRGIQPGKHSLKQLVNAAANQKDALEESFASGKRNRKEAGGRYGW